MRYSKIAYFHRGPERIVPLLMERAEDPNNSYRGMLLGHQIGAGGQHKKALFLLPFMLWRHSEGTNCY